MATQTETPGEVLASGNREIAEALEEVAQLLKAQAANPFRIAAYRSAAKTIRGLKQPVLELLNQEGVDGLRELPGIGESLANSIHSLAREGRLELLERLRGELREENALTSLPGIGEELADRIRQTLGIASLEDLEVAAYDGRLARVPGIGRKRVRAIRESLAQRLGRKPEDVRAAAVEFPDPPPVGELLEVDRLYRHRAEGGQLPQASPRRFNPTRAAWLPVMHEERGHRHYTAMYSNTARAHQGGNVHDWVVVYRDDETGYGQWTVITSRYGPLRGRRIVRGRERECREYYRSRLAQQFLELEPVE
jgi:DNA uptake protein ComE-like DNA-binding protein